MRGDPVRAVIWAVVIVLILVFWVWVASGVLKYMVSVLLAGA